MNIVDRTIIIILFIALEDSLRPDGVIHAPKNLHNLAIITFYLLVSVFYGWAWSKFSEYLSKGDKV